MKEFIEYCQQPLYYHESTINQAVSKAISVLNHFDHARLAMTDIAIANKIELLLSYYLKHIANSSI